jgi:pyruvate,orthophosphate dikinase
MGVGTMSKKYLYRFNEGGKDMRAILGGKGANLAEMTRIGLPVPPGVTISSEACRDYYQLGKAMPGGLREQVIEQIHYLEEVTGKGFGNQENPLLVSVRSGAAVSMPGMMDTILNLGLNDDTVQGLAAATGDNRFALDCYRRFIMMYSDVVLGIEHIEFETIMRNFKSNHKLTYDQELTPSHLEEIIDKFKKIIKMRSNEGFPNDPVDQLLHAVQAVFSSWDNPRAELYRKLNKIPDDLGTAVNIQAMVFGNMGDTSGTGVAFTRNPSTGANELYGEYLVNAQGEDVVAGIRTPQPIAGLKQEMPAAYEQFLETCGILEKHYRDLQDIEFTIEKEKLYILQTRSGKRTAMAAVKVAVDMVNEGLITKQEAITRVDAEQVDKLLHPTIDTDIKTDVLAKGLPASPGAASGQIVFDSDEAEQMGNKGVKVILVRGETTPDDLNGIVGAEGVLTSRGGMTSHAAVVARGMGKPCVCGCEAARIDHEGQTLTLGQQQFAKHDIITIDGSTGNVIAGEVKLLMPELSDEFKTLLGWADEISSLGVRANADNAKDATKAREFGAKGIGLCRTEHMFMGSQRTPIVQKMILASDSESRKQALLELLPIQQQDFYELFKVMDGYPVTIRLLDPPLHEFLPNREELLAEIIKMKYENAEEAAIKEKEALLAKVKSLSEANPMLGHRGCRLGITYPEIYATQVEAIMRAACQLVSEGVTVIPEIEIPLVMDVKELDILRAMTDELAQKISPVVMCPNLYASTYF